MSKVTFLLKGAGGVVGEDRGGQSQGAVARIVEKSIVSELNPADGTRANKPGIAYEFRQGRIELDQDKDAHAIEFLRAHAQNGFMYVEQGNEPGRPKPELTEVMAELTNASLSGNVAVIVDRRTAELDTHSRADVLHHCRITLEALADHGLEDAREALESDPETAVAAA